MEAQLERAIERDEVNEVARLERELYVPPLPPAMTFLWLDYNRLRNRKAFGFNGHNPIEWHDIEAFMRITGRRLSPWMVEILEGLDQLFLASSFKKAGGGGNVGTEAKGVITADAFDAMFG